VVPGGLDELERQLDQLKIVGPFEGAKPRQMLINRTQWHEMQLVQGTAPLGPTGDGAPLATADE
jgi:hypothetical protein